MKTQFESMAPYIIGEIGPNFATSADRDVRDQQLARLVDVAMVAGASAVKLQLKSLDGYYKNDSRMIETISDSRSPFKTRMEYVRAREPDERVLHGVDRYCRQRGLDWSASPWDIQSVDILSRFDVPWVKVASASLTDLELLAAIRAMGKPVILSTGMSDITQVTAAYEALDGVPVCMLYCVSTYPSHEDEIDLRVMDKLKQRFGCEVGYSGHERGIGVSVAAAARGAVVIERHITMSRSAWGPDHAASLEPDGFIQLVRECKFARRAAMDGSGMKTVTDEEREQAKRLRRTV